MKSTTSLAQKYIPLFGLITIATSVISALIYNNAENKTLGLMITIIVGVIGAIALYGACFKLFTEITRTGDALAKAASGDLNVRLTHVHPTDQLGRLQQNINKLLDHTEAFSREAGAALKYASNEEYFRSIFTDGMHGNFKRQANIINAGLLKMDTKTQTFEENSTQMAGNIRSVVAHVLENVHQIQMAANNMSEIALQTSTQSEIVAKAAQSSAQNVGSVASATEEFSASIEEVSQQVQRSTVLSRSAVERTRHADTTIQALSETASRINQVIKLINDIAENTKLLALNATIEAARAGEYGKGFAVVAGEVKNLSEQTAKATHEIVQQVKTMQLTTDEAVEAIQHVTETINAVEEASSVIASAIEQQRAAVIEIGTNVHAGVNEVNHVAEIIVEVANGANSTSSASQQITSSASGLQSKAMDLNEELEQFLISVTKEQEEIDLW